MREDYGSNTEADASTHAYATRPEPDTCPADLDHIPDAPFCPENAERLKVQLIAAQAKARSLR